ncbi:MAG: NUDIX domain-containing protein [Lachnospiraceae bacterium]|nr:NUDIX domain-containing protein [Lachnospiraceae bacterium]
MRFSYCPHCGSKLTKKEIGDEGLVPFCEPCNMPLFDMFSTCVICAVTNECGEVALLKQTNLSATRYVCVSGFMKIGESAETSAAREIEEEIGQKVEEISFVRSYPYEQKEMLMLGFHAKVKKNALVLSKEVDDAEWVPFHEALGKIREGSIAWQLVKEVTESVAE